MPKVTMRECPFTGEIIAGDKKYAQHLREVRAYRKARRDRRRAEHALRQYCHQATANIASVGELCAFVENIPIHDDGAIVKLWNQAKPELRISGNTPYGIDTVEFCKRDEQIRWDVIIDHDNVRGFKNTRDLVAFVLDAYELGLFQSSHDRSRFVFHLSPPDWPGLTMTLFQGRLAK